MKARKIVGEVFVVAIDTGLIFVSFAIAAAIRIGVLIGCAYVVIVALRYLGVI